MSETHAQSGDGGVEVLHGDGRFYIARGGRTLAELIYSIDDGGRAILEHTEVSDELRGQGVARRLVEAAVAWARESGTRLVPICPFASAIFRRDASLRDVLA